MVLPRLAQLAQQAASRDGIGLESHKDYLVEFVPVHVVDPRLIEIREELSQPLGDW